MNQHRIKPQLWQTQTQNTTQHTDMSNQLYPNPYVQTLSGEHCNDDNDGDDDDDDDDDDDVGVDVVDNDDDDDVDDDDKKKLGASHSRELADSTYLKTK